MGCQSERIALPMASAT